MLSMFDKTSVERRLSSQDIIESLSNLKQLIFEVTDACNLRCKYCGYGDLYFGYDKRESNFLPIEQAKAVIDYLVSYWRKYPPKAKCPTTYISFYGGEPLLNMTFIEEIVEYVENLNIDRTFEFSMTSNAVLLDRYMDYLVEKKFHLLISLDGDKSGNGFRITPSGKESFDTVFANAKTLQSKYPEYFQEYVNFNSVLHSLNSVQSTYRFIKKEFQKTPTMSELNDSHIKEQHREYWNSIYRNKIESIRSAENSEELERELFIENPETFDLLVFLRQYSGNTFKDYESLLVNPDNISLCPTGTCIPFSRKMFVTVTGKILQCEKIDHNYALGNVSKETGVTLDINSIVDRINGYYDKLRLRCSKCAKKLGCTQCMYFIDDLDCSKPFCSSFWSSKMFEQYMDNSLGYLSEHPELYDKLTTEVYVD